MNNHLDPVVETLERAFAQLVDPGAPEQLVAAMRHAVFAGGKRLRPQLVMQVAAVHGVADEPAVAAAAAALELLHCASLVHDDLPCFDDADVRRGRPTVHRRFGEPTAVLAGDALIVLAFDLVATLAGDSPHCARLIRTLARASGANGGLAAGQAAELSDDVAWQDYHRAKTGSLFEAAVELGAIVGGAIAAEWIPVGAALGAAYQLSDDLLDVVCEPHAAGKPTGQDARRDRPNGAAVMGVPEALEHVKELLACSINAIPEGSGADIRAWIVRTAASLYSAHGGPKLKQPVRTNLQTPTASPSRVPSEARVVQ